MRMIDADAERERLKKGYCEECTRKGNYGIFGAACTPCWVKDAVEEFDNAPTIEAEPVRRGRWERHSCEQIKCLESGVYRILSTARCSVCRRWAEHVDDIEKIVTYELCPNCGARMDGGEKNVLDQ